MLKISILVTCLKISNIRFKPHPSGANELGVDNTPQRTQWKFSKYLQLVPIKMFWTFLWSCQHAWPGRNTTMPQYKTAVTPVLMHWSYCSLARSHRFINLPYTIHPMNYIHSSFWLCFVVVSFWWIHIIHLPIFIRTASLVPRQSYNASECQWSDYERCNFHSRKWKWKWYLQNGSRLVSTWKCWILFIYLDLSLLFLVTFPLSCVVFVFLLNVFLSPYWALEIRLGLSLCERVVM